MVEEKKKKDKAKANLKLINTTSGIRVSQACDRCRIKKIKCDGLTPCHNCSKIGFDCKTSDKLTRRAFPKGYTENLENRVKILEEENKRLKMKAGEPIEDDEPSKEPTTEIQISSPQSKNHTTLINNPIDQIFNLNKKGVIIGNDNLNFESQFNHLLINLNLPFLKISNSHNYLLNDPNEYLYHPSSTLYNQLHNKDLDIIYNPLTSNNIRHDDYLNEFSNLTNHNLPMDIYDLFIKLINNFKKLFNNKKELDNQIVNFFLNYNILIPIFDYKKFMESYDAFHTMYPFMFTYDDATINGFNISNNDYNIVNEYLIVVIQIYAIIMINDPISNLNLLLNHLNPKYQNSFDRTDKHKKILTSLYDFLPYFNSFHVSIHQLQTYLLFLYFSLLTNNKEKSLILLSLINSHIGILGINLNSKNLFFNDLSLSIQQKRDRVKIFWVFKVLLKCFNLKFGFKPSINTTVINPVTIERYFQLTPEKLSSLLQTNDKQDDDENVDELFKTLLVPSIEFLNLINIIIPSSFSPNYYQYLKNSNQNHQQHPKRQPKNLDWILNDGDGDGNDGNLNYNFTQFVTIDSNLSNWRQSLKSKKLNLLPLEVKMGLMKLTNSNEDDNLYHSIELKSIKDLKNFDINMDNLNHYLNAGLPDVDTSLKLIKIQLNFHYLLIRSVNYLNFIVDKDLNNNYFEKLILICQEFLQYFIIIFNHVGKSTEIDLNNENQNMKNFIHHNPHSTGTNPVILDSLGLDVDDEGFVINDFSAKRRRLSNHMVNNIESKVKKIPNSPFNYMLNSLSITNINLKKTIILQMLYSLIYLLKCFKKNRFIDPTIVETINLSIELFIKIFINYEVNTKAKPNSNFKNKTKEDELFKKLINDELRDQILKEPRDDDDELSYNYNFQDLNFNNFNNINEIDWDDEEMDEDLKYLKILKFIKYKVNQIKEVSKKKQRDKPQESNTIVDTPKSEERRRSVNLPPPPSISNFFSSSPPKFAPSLSKMPSITKLDYLIPEDNFPTHTLTGSMNYVTSNDREKEDLLKREKLAVNDLMSLKRGHSNSNTPNFSS
ncbi:hypothetical protein CLIB1444_07S00320 [[Candida] jaroonii]|uniref:Uncharacterized protein n=1 Tax=[Candida] jaroonii TaxID=467808 RepID=A0ACA9Y9G7_9ASCO|nr:hypothetical protein CLIB1444_07S00320 [[Candida] jaroonii]